MASDCVIPLVATRLATASAAGRTSDLFRRDHGRDHRRGSPASALLVTTTTGRLEVDGSAVCARCVRPSFIRVILASGVLRVPVALDPFFLRVRSNRANSARDRGRDARAASRVRNAS